ncbi:vitamin K epoxide reductase family protein [Aquimarina sp. W85]|uniref:vitamin K epoxide reductase family protein n=1 Tax=Aquimarina rhodophyticola TaxID=3342246 RepID=UPI00366E8339
MANTIEQITNSLLIKNKISGFDKQDLELQLQIHPNYPSFQSITDTLDYFNIENIAVEVPKEALDQLPKSFVTLLEHNDKTEIAVITRSEKKVFIKHSSLTKSSLSNEDFLKIWVPKIIAVEEGESIQKSNTANNKLKQTLLGIASISAAAYLFFSEITVLDFFILIVSVVGTILSYFAVRESLGYKSQALQSICTTIKHSNCNEVITSKKGELISGFTFADAGMIFFSVLCTYAIFFGIDGILLVPTLIGFPFILYSLYAQQFIIKQWCVLCIGISLATIIVGVILYLSEPFQITPFNSLKLIIISSIVALVYLYLKTYIAENRQFKSSNIKLLKFKRNPKLFEQLLSKSNTIEQGDFAHEIILGNPEASFTIVSLTNPLCGFCRTAFGGYVRAIRSLGNDIKIVIRMPISTEKLDAPALRIALRLLEIFEDKGQEGFIEAYYDWFGNRTIESWLKNNGQSEFAERHLKLLNDYREWATKNKLNYTPATIINNKLYPKTYDYEELFYFTQHLLEKFKDETLTTNQVAHANL